jgi:hypothetical protein
MNITKRAARTRTDWRAINEKDECEKPRVAIAWGELPTLVKALAIVTLVCVLATTVLLAIASIIFITTFLSMPGGIFTP